MKLTNPHVTFTDIGGRQYPMIYSSAVTAIKYALIFPPLSWT